MTPLRFTMCAVCMAVAVSASAQKYVGYQEQPWPITSETRPDRQFAKRLAELRGGSFDPAAQQELDLAREVTASFFRLPPLNQVRAATSHVGHVGDVLTVEWRFSDETRKGVVLLLDTPPYATYYFRFEGVRATNEDVFKTLLDGLLAEPKPTHHTSALVVASNVLSDGSHGFSGLFRRPIPSSFYGSGIYIHGLSRRGYTYLTIATPKGETPFAKHLESQVPLRFPPLEIAVQNWSDEEIIAKIGKSHYQDPGD